MRMPDTLDTNQQETERAQDWLFCGDTGLSSKAIWQMMMLGHVAPRYQDVPADKWDFGRCHRLLLLIPAWRARIGEMAVLPGWAPVVEAWDELEALFRNGGDYSGRLKEIQWQKEAA
jgi:hypothetical protein